MRGQVSAAVMTRRKVSTAVIRVSTADSAVISHIRWLVLFVAEVLRNKGGLDLILLPNQITRYVAKQGGINPQRGY